MSWKSYIQGLALVLDPLISKLLLVRVLQPVNIPQDQKMPTVPEMGRGVVSAPVCAIGVRNVPVKAAAMCMAPHVH